MKLNLVKSMLAAAVLALVPMSAFGENAKEEAEEEIRKAFEEAEMEIEEEAEEAHEEIERAAQEAHEEIEQAAEEAKADNEGQQAIDEAMNEVKEVVKEAMREANGAVDEIKQEASEAIIEAREEAREAVEECKEGQDDKGGGGAFSVTFLRFDTGPFEKLNKKESDLMGKIFDFDKRTMVMIGGLGYYDVGGGTRVGVGGSVGYKMYVSDVYTTIDTVAGTNVVAADSAALLRIWPAYLGFNFEKAFFLNKVTIFMGGLFGGGVYIVYKDFEDRSNPSAFIDISSDSSSSSDEEFGGLGAATFMACDLHAGVGFKLAPVFELGIEPYVLLNYAPEGFGSGFGDFFAANPGVRLRFTFGKKS
jgi:hypothetical protein